MAKDLFSRYVWLIDTFQRYGSLTRRELNQLWLRSPFSNGEELPRRTFYTYRAAIEELFKINIECNQATFEYYIEQTGDNRDSVVRWMLNSASIGNMLNDASLVADKIFLEEVPSAREHLTQAVDALKEQRRLKISYHPYTRIYPTNDIVLEPYFLKVFKQRWYLTGLNVAENRVKTYALDRITDSSLLPTNYTIPDDFDAQAYFRDSYGIIFDEGNVHDISIKVEPRQAKYFRSVPLHHSQHEDIHDSYSIFRYRMKITPDLVQELLSYGPKVTVVSPRELRVAIVESLRSSLANYS